ncbi:MAG: hypothetical protein KC656_28390 [Myxococcales bacterium]|nr:hypothetical protein [Myxococcales bacterium]
MSARSIDHALLALLLAACTPDAPGGTDKGDPGDLDGTETDVAGPDDTGTPPGESDTPLTPTETDDTPIPLDTGDTMDTFPGAPLEGDIEIMRVVGYDPGELIHWTELVVVARRVHGAAADKWFIAQDRGATAQDRVYGGLAVRTGAEDPPQVGDVVTFQGTYDEFPKPPTSPPPVAPYMSSLATITVTPASRPEHSLTVVRSGEPLPSPVVLMLEEIASPSTATCRKPPICGDKLLEALESMRVVVQLPGGSSQLTATSPVRSFTNTRGLTLRADGSAWSVDLVDMLTPLFGPGGATPDFGERDTLTGLRGILVSQAAFRRVAPASAADVIGYTDRP